MDVAWPFTTLLIGGTEGQGTYDTLRKATTNSVHNQRSFYPNQRYVLMPYTKCDTGGERAVVKVKVKNSLYWAIIPFNFQETTKSTN